VYLNVIFLDDDAWPHLGHEFVLGDQMAMAAYQNQQYVKRSLTHGNGYAVGGELALMDQQTERSELVGFPHPGDLELWCRTYLLFETQGQAILTMTSFIIHLARKAAHKMDAKITNLRILERAR